MLLRVRQRTDEETSGDARKNSRRLKRKGKRRKERQTVASSLAVWRRCAAGRQRIILHAALRCCCCCGRTDKRTDGTRVAFVSRAPLASCGHRRRSTKSNPFFPSVANNEQNVSPTWPAAVPCCDYRKGSCCCSSRSSSSRAAIKGEYIIEDYRSPGVERLHRPVAVDFASTKAVSRSHKRRQCYLAVAHLKAKSVGVGLATNGRACCRLKVIDDVISVADTVVSVALQMLISARHL